MELGVKEAVGVAESRKANLRCNRISQGEDLAKDYGMKEHRDEHPYN